MSVVRKSELVSVEEYLDGELHAPVKHEYLGGFVYAMAGARNVHNLIASNTLISLGFVRQVYEGMDAVIPLGEIQTELPLREIYDGVEFSPEAAADEI